MKYVFLAIGGIVVVGAIVLWAAVTVVPTAFAPTPIGPLEKQVVFVGEHELEVEVARIPQEQVQGLSGREFLPENAGMLFVYERPAMVGFWMLDMHFALDIIWIDESGIIVGIAENVAPETYPKLFYPPSPVQYVLEVNGGWVLAHGVSAGDQVELGMGN